MSISGEKLLSSLLKDSSQKKFINARYIVMFKQLNTQSHWSGTLYFLQFMIVFLDFKLFS